MVYNHSFLVSILLQGSSLVHVICRVSIKACVTQRRRDQGVLPAFRSMSRSTQGPSLTTPKSSATRGDLRVLHAPTSSLLNLFMAICKDATQGEQTGRRLENGTRSEVPRYLFDSKLEACVDILSAVYFTIGTVFDKLRENVLPPLLVLRVHWLDFLMEQSDKLVYQTKLKPAEEQR